MQQEEIKRLLVDFTFAGHAQRFSVPVLAHTRRNLHMGDTVILFGDDVPETLARVLSVSDERPDVEFELVVSPS